MKTLRELRSVGGMKTSSAILSGLFVLFLLSSLYLLYDNYRKTEAAVNRQREMGELMSTAYMFSAEKYHTQLEFWEFAYSPNPKRLVDFRRQTLDLDKAFEVFSERVHGSGMDVDPGIRAILREIAEYYAEISGGWEKALQASRDGRDVQVFLPLVLALEQTVDRFELDGKIDHIIALQKRGISVLHTSLHAAGRRRIVFSEALVLSIAAVLVVVVLLSMLRGRLLFRRLVQAEKLATLGQMSAGMAHELNNPLMSIKGFNNRVRSALHKSGSATAELTDYLGEIDDGVDRMSKIINHLRIFSRASESTKVLFSVNATIQRAFDFFDEQLRLRGIRVDLVLCPEDAQVAGASNRLEQALINLISNARDALAGVHDRPEPFIRVSTVVERERVLIRFEDNGPGIPKSIIGRIFEPFFSTKPAGVGTGLGLSIVNEIVVEHSGEVAVESLPDKGAIFTIQLPVAR